jgi:hypothetical protein
MRQNPAVIGAVNKPRTDWSSTSTAPKYRRRDQADEQRVLNGGCATVIEAGRWSTNEWKMNMPWAVSAVAVCHLAGGSRRSGQSRPSSGLAG